MTELLIDSTVFSNFAYSDSIDTLLETVDKPQTTHEVIRELQRGQKDGYEFLNRATRLMGEPGRNSTAEDNEIRAAVVSPDESVWPLQDVSPDEVYEQLDSGEASIICRSIQTFSYLYKSPDSIPDDQIEHTPIATDDRDAREFAEKLNIEKTGSIGILAKAVKDGIITVETADKDLHSWLNGNGYRSPVESIGEVLDD